MKTKIVSSVVGWALASFVTVAMACPENPKCSGGKDVQAVKATEGPENSVVEATDKADAKAGKKCSLSGKTVAETDGDEGCPIAKKAKAVLASLPSMKYQVGEEVTCCPKAAKEIAEKSHQPIKYLVGEAAFEKEDDAEVKLAALLEDELQSMQNIQFAVGDQCSRCPMTARSMAKKANAQMTYRVAGIDFPDQEKAEKVLALVKEAADNVNMTYKVGDEKFCCSKMAGAKCTKTGTKMAFVVGDAETGCEISAKVLLTEAKIRAAVEAAAGALSS